MELSRFFVGGDSKGEDHYGEKLSSFTAHPEGSTMRATCSTLRAKPIVAYFLYEKKGGVIHEKSTLSSCHSYCLSHRSPTRWRKRGDKKSSSSTGSTNTVAAPEKVSKPVIPIPAGQTDFIKLVSGYVGDYKKAPNELKKSALRLKRGRAIKEFFGGDLSGEWVGKLTRLTTTTEQNAHVTIELLGTDMIAIKNYNNELSDLGSDTLIKAESGLFNAVSELGTGDTVKVTGSFLPGDDDHIDESSLSERGAMTDPAFIFKFTGIEKIGAS